MRSFLTWPMALLATLFCGLTLQQWQLIHLRRQLAQQAVALTEGRQQISALTGQLAEAAAARAGARDPLRRPGVEGAFWREDERRLMLSGYAGFLAQANLPPGRSDARDAASQQGIAEGTPDMAQATQLATADIDREIAGLLGTSPTPFLPEAVPAVETPAYAAAPAYPVYLGAPPEAPAYAYLSAAPAAPAEQVAAESPAVEYVPVNGVYYIVRREGRFDERPLEGRRFVGGPRPPEGRSPLERPRERFPVRTAPVH
jgi:hypothetical protein